MARPLRLEFAGALYHLTARGDRREPIFLDDEDRSLFIGLLAKEVRQQGWLLYAFCLMDNHYHLLVETPEPNLVRGMRRLNGVYTQAFNRRHGLVGHLLQGRYKAILLDKDSYLLEVCRYVVLNPVRVKKKMAASVKDWAWSSYLPTVGKAACPDWLAAEQVLTLFGKDQPAARKAYERFVAQGVGVASPWESVSGQIFLGKDAFLKKMQKLADTKPSKNVTRTHRQPLRPSVEQVLTQVAKTYGLAQKQVLDRSHPDAFKRAVYLLRRQANLTLNEVATLARISPPRVSQIQAEVEGKENISLYNDHRGL
jgi:REP element-mobilizing transposase RayT